MTTVSSPNADIAQQARTAANRAQSTSTTAKSGEPAADPFAALFDAAMLLQTDPSLATAAPVPSNQDVTDAALPAEDESLATDGPIDPATLLASLPWPVPTDAAPVPTQAVDVDAGDDAAAGLAATAAELSATEAVMLDPAVTVAAATPETTALANLMTPGNQAASGVRRAGQTLGATPLGIQARSDSASDTDTDLKTGPAATDASVDASPSASTTALDIAAAASAAAAGARGGNTGTAMADTGVAAAGVLANDTPTASVAGAPAGSPASARQEIPTVPGAPVPLHAQQLQARVDDAVRWMSTQSIQTAQIRVTPENMGPITVHVQMDGDTANITFSSEHAQTRQVLEASMGGLRTALGENGLQLGQAHVGSEQQNQQAFTSFANSGNGDERRARQAAADRMQATVNALGGPSDKTVRSGNGLVDLYA